MDSNTYPKIYHLRSWSVIISAIVFFILINIGIYFLFHDVDEKRLRFHIPTSYEEILAKIDQVKADPNKKIIIFGASSMWGWGVSNVSDVAPVQFKKYVLPGVSVYNFSFAGARVLDEFAIVALLKNDADLFIVGIMPESLENKYNIGVKDKYYNYIRIQSLLQKNYNYLFTQSPALKQCLLEYGVLPRKDISFDLSRYIPSIRYRSDINEAVLGSNYELVFDEVLANILYAVKGQKVTLSNLFSSREKAAMAVPHPLVNSKFNYMPIPRYQPSINSCILQAFAIYVADSKSPVLFYIAPSDPLLIYKSAIQTGVYHENNSFIKKIISPAKVDVLNVDSINIKTENFNDPNHIDAIGHREFAAGVYQWLKILPTSSVPGGLLK